MGGQNRSWNDGLGKNRVEQILFAICRGKAWRALAHGLATHFHN